MIDDGDNLSIHCKMSLRGPRLTTPVRVKSHFTTGSLPPISVYWRQAPRDSRPAILFQLNTLFHSPCVTSSLTRGWVCSLQLLLALSSAVILGSDAYRLMTIFYCLKFEIPPTWRARFLYLYPPGTGWPSYTPRHRVPFSSPPTTRRAMVEVFNPTSTWEDDTCQIQYSYLITWGQANSEGDNRKLGDKNCDKACTLVELG
jgi:hypothetical protein